MNPFLLAYLIFLPVAAYVNFKGLYLNGWQEYLAVAALTLIWPADMVVCWTIARFIQDKTKI